MNRVNIVSAIRSISEFVKKSPKTPVVLHSGYVGCLLHEFLSELFLNNQLPANFEGTVEQLAMEIFRLANYTFSGGKAGIHWFYC